MSAQPGRGSRARRRNPTATLVARIASLPDDLLLADRDQTAANATSLAVNGRRPQFYGNPTAAASDARRLPLYDAEVARRNLAARGTPEA